MRKEIPPKKKLRRRKEELLEYEKVCALCKQVRELFGIWVAEEHFFGIYI